MRLAVAAYLVRRFNMDYDEVEQEFYSGRQLVDRQGELLKKKNERCKEYARRKSKELVLVRHRVPVIYGELVRLGAYNKLSAEAKEFFDIYVHREEMRQRPYPPTLYRMFADDVRVGASCTLKEAMQRIYRGKNEINTLIKKWKRGGSVVVDVEPADDGNALGLRYVITELHNLKEKKPVSDVGELMADSERASFRDYESRNA